MLSRLFGRQLFEIYGFNGLLLGYVIYTLPISFMLLNNTMGYIDKKFMVVSRIMNDSAFPDVSCNRPSALCSGHWRHPLFRLFPVLYGFRNTSVGRRRIPGDFKCAVQ